MNKKHFISVLSLLAVVITLSSFITTHAESRMIAKDENKPRLLGSGPNKEINLQIKQERCELMKNRITSKVALLNQNKSERESIYNNIKKRITNIITLLEQKSYDVSKLKADLPGWDAKVKKYWDDKNSMIAKLGEAKSLSCTDNKSAEYQQAVKDAKALSEQVKADAKAIGDYYKNTIRADIQSIRSQKVNSDDTNK